MKWATTMERRKTQNVNRKTETPLSLGGEYGEPTYLNRIALQARKKSRVFHNLMHHVNEVTLGWAYGQMDGHKAKGSDGITKKKYGEHLEDNIQKLCQRMRRMAYRPSPARLVLIPKMDGKTRQIAISNFEDKLVQKVASDILTAIYEPMFQRFSFGFRPKRSCHGAIGYLYNKLRRQASLKWVVDVDLNRFFDTINHKRLIAILKQRIGDRRFLQYLTRMLKAGILQGGDRQEAEEGTPQGSIVSPILANVYLNHVLDEWFVQHIQPELGGEMARYADDIVFAFSTEERARSFVERITARLSEHGLSLNKEKTHVICFDPQSSEKRTFDFLGFTFYWGRWMDKTTLKVRTSMKALKKKIQDYDHWIKANRSRYRLAMLWEATSQKLRGHYNYYGVLWNRGKLRHFYHAVVGSLFRWLNRRSQKQSYTWEGFKMRMSYQPLPEPAVSRKLIQLTNPALYCA